MNCLIGVLIVVTAMLAVHKETRPAALGLAFITAFAAVITAIGG